MTDREMLELAAKAAGIDLVWSKFSNVPTLFKGLSSDEVWNPLTDDGDALRLAVKLELMDEVSVMNAQYESDDPLAATRLTIVSAAAELGRSMT